jgi:hypothetical protein
MLTVVFAVAAVICAIGWFLHVLCVRTLLLYMRRKGYDPPSDRETNECAHEAWLITLHLK